MKHTPRCHNFGGARTLMTGAADFRGEPVSAPEAKTIKGSTKREEKEKKGDFYRCEVSARRVDLAPPRRSAGRACARLRKERHDMRADRRSIALTERPGPEVPTPAPEWQPEIPIEIPQTPDEEQPEMAPEVPPPLPEAPPAPAPEIP